MLYQFTHCLLPFLCLCSRHGQSQSPSAPFSAHAHTWTLACVSLGLGTLGPPGLSTPDGSHPRPVGSVTVSAGAEAMSKAACRRHAPLPPQLPHFPGPLCVIPQTEPHAANLASPSPPHPLIVQQAGWVGPPGCASWDAAEFFASYFEVSEDLDGLCKNSSKGPQK